MTIITRVADYLSSLIAPAYLNHADITRLCQAGAVAGWSPECVNTASLDLRLGKTVLVEDRPSAECQPIDYRSRMKMRTKEIVLDDEDGFVLNPGQFILAHTMEVFCVPDNIAAFFWAKSSMGRTGLEHMASGFVDPGFYGSLTLELTNCLQHHSIRIRPGDRIGQLVFSKGRTVKDEHSYKSRGNYNGRPGVMPISFKD